MANTLLTPDQITREALRILHQKLTFIGSVNRQYDDSFAQNGAKIGDTLRIRLPNKYTVRTGAALSTQDTTETNTSLQVSTQKGVDTTFTSKELTMDIDDFSSRILEPAMAVLAADIEADALQTMRKDVYQQVGSTGSAVTFKNFLEGRKALNDSLAPMDNNRCALINTQDNVDLVDSLKGLFQDSKSIGKQYREGYMGRTAGFMFAETTHFDKQSRGAGSGYLTNDATAQTGSTLTVDTGTGAINAGEIITIAGVNRVHPETKVDTGELQQFVVTATYAGGGGDISISPEIVATGARQNVTNGAANNQAVTIVGTASTDYGQSMVFHKDAFTFASADLIMPKGTDMASRQVYDGISMRLVRDYTITDDSFPARFDVLYGFKTIRPELAARIAAN